MKRKAIIPLLTSAMIITSTTGLVKRMLPLVTIGSFAGTWIVTKINSQNLKTYFSYFLVFIGIYEIITSLKRIKKAKNNTNRK